MISQTTKRRPTGYLLVYIYSETKIIMKEITSPKKNYKKKYEQMAFLLVFIIPMTYPIKLKANKDPKSAKRFIL